jgi:hypothetical protein
LKKLINTPYELGKLFSMEIMPGMKKFDFLGLTSHWYGGEKPRFTEKYDFMKSSDRITMGIRSIGSYSMPCIYEVVAATPLPSAITAIIQKQCKPEENENYNREPSVSATLEPPEVEKNSQN